MTTPDDIETRIRDFFENNFEALQLEGGHSLAPEVKEAALQQVLLYWRRLSDIANRVTDTEVRLNLPDQCTPKGRHFGIDGVVDIVRENDRVIMYDLKTHAADVVRANREFYARQLNVYAHIWQHLRGQPLDETAVISTQYPEIIKEALASGDTTRLDAELLRWDPVIDIPFDASQLAATIDEFGAVVDAIEDGEFSPPSIAKLRGRASGERLTFAGSVCRNCDARFSCSTYRMYAQESRGTAERRFRSDYLTIDLETDAEREERLLAGLDTMPDLAVLNALI